MKLKMIVGNVLNRIQPTFTANIMPDNCAKHIDEKLKAAKTADIFCHLSSDEDTFNSAKAMYSYLKQNGVTPRIIVSGGKECYQYNTDKYNILQFNQINENTKKSDVALCLDFSSPSRISPDVQKYLNKFDDNIIGIDHHNDSTKITKNFNHIVKSYKSIQDMPKLEAKNYYIDSSSKSNCAIVSRFFEAIGHTPNKEEAKSLFCGMFDDTSKSGLVEVKKNLDLNIKDIDDNGNTKEVMLNIYNKLNIFNKIDVLKHFSNRLKFSKQEKAFKQNLEKRVQTSTNGKFAYIEISQNDKEWESLGRDSEKTKLILSKFRKNTLNKNKNIDAVAVFYPTNQENIYKMSILSRKDYAKQIINHIKENTYPELVAGGHYNRSGGTINSSDKNECQKWVELFKNAAEAVL